LKIFIPRGLKLKNLREGRGNVSDWTLNRSLEASHKKPYKQNIYLIVESEKLSAQRHNYMMPHDVFVLHVGHPRTRYNHKPIHNHFLV